MIERILKLDLRREEPNSPKRRRALRWLVLGAALAALFAGVVMAILFALPKPHTQPDYLTAGGLATMITILALFGALLTTSMRDAHAFYKRRSKGDRLAKTTTAQH